MIDKTAEEQAAIKRAGKAGGEYLESIGKVDLSSLTEDEWLTFIECIVTEWSIPF